MARAMIGTAVALAALLQGSVAAAGPYTDDLSKCLVRSTSGADQSTLMQWMFGLLALNPAVKADSVVTAPRREAYDRKAAALMERLMTVDCHKETVEAIKFEGNSAIEASFRVLGEVAFRGLMSDPSVAADLQAFAGYVDPAKLTALGKEAGVVDPPAKPAH
jgi:hypothetical protein